MICACLVLKPYDLATLQLVSREFRSVCLDNNFWKARCFQDSPYLGALKRRRQLHINRSSIIDTTTETTLNLNDRVANSNNDPTELGNDGIELDREEYWDRQLPHDLANWDPSYIGEHISWYHEYIQRNAPVVVNWLQQPRTNESNVQQVIEARGVALFRREGTVADECVFAVSPLDDGSVCLWDVKGTTARKGAIIGKSKPGILFIDGPGTDTTRRSKKIDTGVTECVAIESQGNRAFFAVQSRECADNGVSWP
jgi:hypothetical protein